MKLKLSILLSCVSFSLFAQSDVKATEQKLKVVRNKTEYLQSILNEPDNQLLEIKKVIPSIKLDIRYATENNFMKQVMYKEARAFARKPVVLSLKKIQEELNKKGYGLKIFDAYRPYTITVAFYEKASDKAFVANPAQGSRHNRGCAVDLTIIDLKTGKEIAMATPYDSFSKAAAADYPDVSDEVKKNRSFLIEVMQRHNFKVLENEWWHFDFNNWKNYDLMDIPFQQL
ncbi:M15 family metallopeptidase [Pedobacter sp. MW01-1-1]|uniref:M15 family metallopeptidase n=1 Tax=Pedobacter sp. MW01-1-1 TaxID=3383027 RepID=UPI003FEFD2DE